MYTCVVNDPVYTLIFKYAEPTGLSNAHLVWVFAFGDPGFVSRFNHFSPRAFSGIGLLISGIET